MAGVAVMPAVGILQPLVCENYASGSPPGRHCAGGPSAEEVLALFAEHWEGGAAEDMPLPRGATSDGESPRAANRRRRWLWGPSRTWSAEQEDRGRWSFQLCFSAPNGACAADLEEPNSPCKPSAANLQEPSAPYKSAATEAPSPSKAEDGAALPNCRGEMGRDEMPTGDKGAPGHLGGRRATSGSVAEGEGHGESSGRECSPALADDVLRHIFLLLSPRDLARAAQVSRRWRHVARSQDIHVLWFKRKWGLDHVSGAPMSPKFWLLESPPFVLEHALKPTDTMASVAVRYACQIGSLRRVNNMMSDYGIHTRTRLLVPISADWIATQAGAVSSQRQGGGEGAVQGAEDHGGAALPQTLRMWLHGQRCNIQFDAAAKRDVAILEVNWGFNGSDSDESESDELRSDAADTQRNAAKKAEARAKIVKMMMRAFGVDQATAAYYLDDAQGDVRAASQALRADFQWESQHTVRPGP